MNTGETDENIFTYIQIYSITLRQKWPYSELFWPAFWMRENADQNNSEYGQFLRSVKEWLICGHCVNVAILRKLTVSTEFRAIYPILLFCQEDAI